MSDIWLEYSRDDMELYRWLDHCQTNWLLLLDRIAMEAPNEN